MPIQPRRFFDLLWSRLLEPGLGSLLSPPEGRAVAAGVFLDWNGTVVYKFGASDPALCAFVRTTSFLWSAIRRACDDGHRRSTSAGPTSRPRACGASRAAGQLRRSHWSTASWQTALRPR